MRRRSNMTRPFSPQGRNTPQMQMTNQISGPSRGQRPKEVPVLDLETLVDREYEPKGPAFTSVAGNPSGLLSAMSWGTAVSTHPPQSPSEDYHQSPQSSCRGQSLSNQSSNNSPQSEPPYLTPHSSELSHIQTDVISTRKLEAEELTLKKRKQAVIEQMMVDQLSRAVISDPEQNATNQFSVSARHRRPLHHTMIKTQKSLTENLLSHKLCFHARILSRFGREACRELIGFFFTCDQTLTVYEYRSFGKNRCSALPFIARGVYKTRGRPYCLADFSQGADLHFRTDVPHLSETLRQLPYLTLRVTEVDEEAKRQLQGQFGERVYCLSEEEINDRKTLNGIQEALRARLRGHAIPTLICLGRRLQSLDLKHSGLIGKGQLRECLMEELGLSQQDFEAVCRVVGHHGGPLVDYSEMMRAVTGELSEIRKAIFFKVYVKLDPNKTGFISLSDIEKFYSIKASLHLDREEADFLTFIRASGKVIKGMSYAEFEDYYEGLSIEIHSDQEYIDILKSTWSI